MMAMMWIQIRRKKHCEPIMEQCRIRWTEGIVLERLIIGQQISDL
jgi:hypothetical protein